MAHTPYKPKTNWVLDETVMPEDMNRIEQGVYDAQYIFSDDGLHKYKHGVDSNGMLYIEEVKM